MSSRNRDRQTKNGIAKRPTGPTIEEDEALGVRHGSADALKRTLAGPAPAVTPADILALQRSVGNQTVQRLLAQRRAVPNADTAERSSPESLRVSTPGDAAEREADRLATEVTGVSAAATRTSARRPSDAGEAVDDNGLAADAEQAVAAAAHTGGQPLPGGLQQRLGSSLGVDVSGVRVHTGPESQAAAEAVSARAYTIGQDIHFAEEQFDPSSEAGQRLIAHEVAHTIQQGATPARRQHAAEASLGKPTPAVTPSPSMIQRDWWDVVPNLPPLPGFGPAAPAKPAEANWDVPPVGAIDDLAPGWNEQPNFPSGYLAHERTPELDTGKVRFQNDWTQLTQSWNTSAQLAARFNIKAKLPDIHASEINGQPAAPPKTLVPDAENVQPSGKQDFPIGSIFNDANNLDAKKPFDPDRLTGPDRASYDKKIAETTKTRNDREKARIFVDSKVVLVKNAFSQLRQAKIKEKQAEKAAESKDVAAEKTVVATEKAQVEAVVKGAESILAAGVKNEPQAAIGATMGMITALYYNDKLGQLDLKLNQLDKAIADLQVSYEMETVIQAKNNISVAMNEVKQALPDLNTALQNEKTAFNDLALEIERLAKLQGLDPESVRVARTAASALPLIEETIGNFSQIEASVQIPAYTSTSGIGASLVTNLDAFKTHLGQLKGYRVQVVAAKQKWLERRNAAQKGVGVPGQTTL